MQRRGHASRSGEPLEGRTNQNLLVAEPFGQWTAMVCGMGRHPLEAQAFTLGSRHGYLRYLRKFGLRFSIKAFLPSWASSLR